MSVPPHDGGVVIRVAQETDRAELLQIAASVQLFSPEELEELSALLPGGSATMPGGPGCWLLAEHSGQPAGLAFYAPEKFTDGTWNLYLLAVHPDRQRGGLGAALIGSVEQALRSAGARMLLIETADLASMSGTHRFYERCGFQQEAHIRDFYAAGTAKIVFRKLLQTLKLG